MDHWGVDTPDRSLIPHLPALALYALFFCCGWLLHRVPDLLVELTRISWLKIGLMVLSIVVCVLLSPFESQYGHPNYFWLKMGFIFSYSIMMWSLVLLLIGACGRLFSQPNAVVRYMADTSYWMYLIHLPIVVFLQVALADIELFWWLKLSLIVTTTVAMSIMSYDACVRSTRIGQLLNGKRKSRVLFTLNRDRGLANENH
jgi:peptidoglycan/LPS O-acetylase OafA/YrhL